VSFGHRASMRAAGSRNVRFLTVGQTARILGISCSTLRLWENVDLVTAARSARSYRLYTPELQDVLKRIKYLRDVKKLNVPGIKEALGSAAPPTIQSLRRKPTPDLGDKLRRLRKKVSLTVTEAAQRAQISPSFRRHRVGTLWFACAIKPRDSATQPQEPGN